MILTFTQQLPPRPLEPTFHEIAAFFASRGFRSASRSSPPEPDASPPRLALPHPLLLQRGSLWGNLFGYSMERLRQRATVGLLQEPDGALCLSIRYEVSTLGQLISDTDRRFFQEEVCSLLESLGGQVDPEVRRRAHRRRSRREQIVRHLLLASFCFAVAYVLGRWLLLS
ncbi:MAG: hypothetical protein RBU45_18805 [Myxococcota bacterium]|jgi:hypothetical protein|nr:hypothetical protein [Myxococcota bacterium]